MVYYKIQPKSNGDLSTSFIWYKSWSFNGDRIQLNVQGKIGSTKPPAMPWSWGPESVPETSENLHILKQPSAWEDLIVLASFVTRDAQHEYLAWSSWNLKGYVLFLYVASLLFSKRWRCLKIVFCTTVILLVLGALVAVVLQLMAPRSCKQTVKISGLHKPLKI